MLCVYDHCASTRIVGDEDELGSGKPEIQWHKRRTEPRSREHDDKEKGLVEAEKGDAIAAVDAELP